MRSGVRTLLLSLIGSAALMSCTYLQGRSDREFSGVVLDETTERPVEGAVVMLHETRVPFLPFPFMTEEWWPIAHTITGEDGRFSFRVCMTDGPFLLDWDRRGASREPLWRDEDPANVHATLYVEAPPAGRPTQDIDYWLGLEDSSFTKSCR